MYCALKCCGGVDAGCIALASRLASATGGHVHVCMHTQMRRTRQEGRRDALCCSDKCEAQPLHWHDDRSECFVSALQACDLCMQLYSTGAALHARRHTMVVCLIAGDNTLPQCLPSLVSRQNISQNQTLAPGRSCGSATHQLGLRGQLEQSSLPQATGPGAGSRRMIS